MITLLSLVSFTALASTQYHSTGFETAYEGQSNCFEVRSRVGFYWTTVDNEEAVSIRYSYCDVNNTGDQSIEATIHEAFDEDTSELWWDMFTFNVDPEEYAEFQFPIPSEYTFYRYESNSNPIILDKNNNGNGKATVHIKVSQTDSLSGAWSGWYTDFFLDHDIWDTFHCGL